MKIEWFEERIGDGPYQHISCGWRMDITDSPYREALLRNAELEHTMMVEGLSTRIFSEDDGR